VTQGPGANQDQFFTRKQRTRPYYVSTTDGHHKTKVSRQKADILSHMAHDAVVSKEQMERLTAKSKPVG